MNLFNLDSIIIVMLLISIIVASIQVFSRSLIQFLLFFALTSAFVCFAILSNIEVIAALDCRFYLLTKAVEVVGAVEFGLVFRVLYLSLLVVVD